MNVVLLSIVIAAVVSAIVSAIVSIILKRLDYRNEYYKKILQKRLNTYEYLEKQVAVLNAVAKEPGKKPYHQIFSYDKEKFSGFQKDLYNAMSFGFWMSKRSKTLMDELNIIIYMADAESQSGKKDLKQIGQEAYREIAELRVKLEEALRDDLSDLHEVKRFFKRKGT